MWIVGESEGAIWEEMGGGGSRQFSIMAPIRLGCCPLVRICSRCWDSFRSRRRTALGCCPLVAVQVEEGWLTLAVLFRIESIDASVKHVAIEYFGWHKVAEEPDDVGTGIKLFSAKGAHLLD